MKNNFKLSRYHLNVILLYLILTPFLLYFFADKIRYDFSKNIGPAFAISIFSLILFFGFLSIKKWDDSSFKVSKIIFAILYGVVFAFPEEIIFRGIIQSFIQDYFVNTFFIVLLSSITFGLAHLLNTAKGFYPNDWNWKLAGLTLLAGIPLSLIFAITNSLLFPSILHALFVIFLQMSIKNEKP